MHIRIAAEEDPGAELRLNLYSDCVGWRFKLGGLAETADLPEDIRRLLRQAVGIMDRTAQGSENNAWAG